MEDYREKYEKVLSQAKQAIDNIPDKSLAKWLQSIFPELKESEDERMRAMAIKAVHAPEAQSCIKSWGINPDDVIAWIEKQGEQKQAEWSEEDENLLNLSLENLRELKNRFGYGYGKVGNCIHWLKSLKQRMKGK